MDLSFRSSWVFLILAIGCGALYWHSPEPSLLLGIIYGSAFALRFPKQLSAKILFPFVMLFLFLMVLNGAPTKAFTMVLIYTVQALLVFRAMLLTLGEIQLSRASTSPSQISWIVGLTLELAFSVLLIYSSFKPVSPNLLGLRGQILGGPLIILTSLFMPYWIFGVILGALSFVPKFRIWVIIGFGLLALYESNFSKKSRNTPS
jgi:hypothetical protein